jgi:phosphatidylserine/phosphatidylglycerophosphate/cardiolipin synthase-like enzyme
MRKIYILTLVLLLSNTFLLAQITFKEADFSVQHLDNTLAIEFDNASSKDINFKAYDAFTDREVSVSVDTNNPATYILNDIKPAQILKVNYYADSSKLIQKTNYIATASLSTGDIKVFFNHPVDTNYSQIQNAVNLSNTLEDKLIEYINACATTLDIAIYNSASPSSSSGLAGAINSAYLRGVKVRVIYDGSSSSNMIPLLNSSIPLLPSPTSSAYTIMHNKFVIFDANSSNANLPLVWTGSTNWTVSQIDGPDKNSAIVIQDQSLALAYQLEFNEMWGSNTLVPNTTLSKFGQYKTDNTPHNFIIGGKKVESYFSPSDGVNSKIIASINSANSDIDIATMLITRFDITTALLNKYNSGLSNTNVVIDSQNPANNQIGAIQSGLLINHAMVYSGSGIMHHKFMVVDNFNSSSDPQVVLGSHNWSTSAETKNDENTLIIHDANITNQYFQAFAYLYQQAGGVFLPNLTTSQISVNQMTIYPTITSDFINISNPDNKNYSYSIYNSLGQKIQSDFTSSKIDLSNNSKGLYFINLSLENQTKTFKVLLK